MSDAKPLTDEEIEAIRKRVKYQCWADEQYGTHWIDREAWLQALATIDALKAEIETDNALLAERDRLLDALLCPAHGRCVPHALEQIASLKSALNAANEKLRRLRKRRA